MLTKAQKARYLAAVFLVFLIGIAFFGAYSGTARKQNAVAQGEPSNCKEQQSCGGENYYASVEAVATIAVAIFTLVLAGSTILLWCATRRSAQLAEDALVKLERPHLRFMPGPNNFEEFWKEINQTNITQSTVMPKVSYAFRNFGKTPAEIKSFRIGFDSSDGIPPLKNATDTQIKGNPVIPPDGSTLNGRVKLKIPFKGTQIEQLRTSKLRLWVYGIVSYRNITGIGRDAETEFLWVFDGPKDTFTPSNEGGSTRNRST